MLVYQDLLSGDELLSDSFSYKEIENGMLWEVEGKWVVQGAVDVDIGANPSAEGADEDEGVDDQTVKVVDIVDTFRLQGVDDQAVKVVDIVGTFRLQGVDDQAVKVVDIVDTFRLQGVDDQAVKVVDNVDTFRLQEQPPFDKKQFVALIKKFIKNLTPKLDAEKQENFKKHIEGATKFLLPKLKDLQFFVGESMHDDGCLVLAYYKDGAVDPTFLYFAYALKEVKC